MLVTTLAHAQKVCQWLASKDWCAFDTETVPNPVFPGETNALIWGRGKVVLWSLCYRGESYSFPTNFADPKYPTMSQWLTVFAPLFQGPTVKVMHNANYDLNILYTEGLPYIRPIWDTMIACWLANPAMEKGLKPRAALYGRFLRETSTVNFANLEELALYAEQDVVQTDELYQMQRFGKILRPEKIPSIAENGKVVTRLNDFKPLGVQKVPEEDLSDFERNFLILQELPVLRATLRAEQVGMPMSLPRFEAIRKRLLVDEESALKRFYAEAGCRPNLNSTKQLVELFQKKKIPLVEFSKKTKAPSLSAKALIKMSGSHPLVDQLLNYRKLVKLKSVYIGDGESSEGLNRFVHPDGRIHCSLATCGAITGRFSSSLPNMQQLPSRADTYSIKSILTAPKGKQMVVIDFMQMELRIMALLSKEPTMTKVLNDPEGDIHQTTADQFGVPRNPSAKNINFLLLYGGMAKMLADNLTMNGVPTTPQQADAYVKRYDQTYGRIRTYREELTALHKQQGFITYLTGRTRNLPNIDWQDWFSCHQAETTLANNIVQGSSQDLLKATIVRCDPRCLNPDYETRQRLTLTKDHDLRLRDYDQRIRKLRRWLLLARVQWVLQVHDEALFFVDKSAAQEIGQAICEVMCWRHYLPATTDYTVRLAVEGGVGGDWAEAKSKTPLFKLHKFGDL